MSRLAEVRHASALLHGPTRWMGWLGRCCAAALALGAVAGAQAQPQAAPADPERHVVVVVDDLPQPLPGTGSTPRGRYAGVAAYAGSHHAKALADGVAQAHGLREVVAWTITALRWRCLLARIAPGTDRAALLSRLAQDPRVRLAQPLNEFETLSAVAAAGTAVPPRYDDPYHAMQRGFASIEAGAAHAWSVGDGVRVALVDTGVDGNHADLVGRVASQRDLVGNGQPTGADGQRHGTQLAGVIGAVANNRIGIVGVAPKVQMAAYRACWPVAGARARCNSFTLALALGAALADGNHIINLSLGGPADPLLAVLLERAQKGGVIVVGALPPSGRLEGFPAGVPGVLTVSVAAPGAPEATGAQATRPAGALAAPGQDIFTLAPGGGYSTASGSSLAAAHVTGVVALLRALEPRLTASQARAWLDAGPAVNACLALRRLRPQALCAATP